MADREDPKFLAWIDIETTGLDMENDSIVEFGLMVTDMEFNALSPVHEWIVKPVDLQQAITRIEENTIVHQMHRNSGLLHKLYEGLGVTLRRLEKDVCQVLAVYGEPQEFLIAGSGVAQFDQPWIRYYLPSVDKFFRYSPFDVGMIRRFVKYTLKRPDLLPADKETHRAGDDLQEALAQARIFKTIFGDVVRPGLDEEM